MKISVNRLKILVIDDDVIQNKLMSVYLSRLNLNNATDYALTIDDAVLAIKSQRPDIIFLDNRIPPEIDFRPSLERIRSAGFDGPVVVQSVAIEDITAKEASACGVMRVIDKFELNEGVLEELVAACWSSKFGRKAARGARTAYG